MAVLHRVRRPSAGGLRPAPAAALASIVMLVSVACREAPPELQPDGMLQDSLGLTTADRVHVVRLAHRDGAEASDPDSVSVRGGDWVDFVGADGRVRVVEFLVDSMEAAPRDFMVGTGIRSSPPLLGRGVHWAVPFEGAPAGRYLFAVSGGGGSGRGVVVVEPSR